MVDRIIDAYSSLSHRAPLRETTGAAAWSPHPWVGEANYRRLRYYHVCQAYLSNVSRYYLDTDDTDAHDNYREYGDASALRKAIRGALLGDEQSIVVEGADDDVPDDEEGEDGEPNAEAAGERARIEAAQDRQEWLRDWATRERFVRKMRETEDDIIGLGDGVYRLLWSGRKQRPLLRIYEPNAYYPVFSDDEEDEFPTTVHLAWEFKSRQLSPTREEHTYVRRITYRLARIGDPGTGQIEERNTETITTYVHPERVRPDGSTVVTRAYPWNDEPSEWTCYMSDGIWLLDALDGRIVPDLTDAGATWRTNDEGMEIRNLDLLIDFIPVVHVPNTSAEKEHFGRSALADVAQVLDDLAATDTDLAAASATTGTPPFWFGGVVADANLRMRPGMAINVGQGQAGILDTSKSLDALLKYKEALEKRLAANARVTDALLGKSDPAKIAAGIILSLTFGPTTQMVDEMRLIREEKNGLIFRFVQRLALSANVIQGDVLQANVTFGSFLPTDLSAVVTIVRQLLGNGTEPPLISRQTALRMLVDAGMAFDDAAEEVERIEGEDFAGAVRLLEATGDEEAVFEYLHRDVPQAVKDRAAGIVPVTGEEVPPEGPPTPALPPAPEET